jgi:hypothetical protein
VRRAGPILPALLAVLLLTGCGSASRPDPVATLSARTAPPADLGPAERPRVVAFPAARGRSLTELGQLATRSVTLSAATGTFTPGPSPSRFAFALQTGSGAFLYAPTVLYIARTAHSPAQGPFLAPADPMGVADRFRSREDTGPDGIQAIYESSLPLPHAGTYQLLSLTHTSAGVIGATGEVAVAPSSPIPGAGQRMPALSTLTTGSVRTSLLTTRVPAEHMASASLRSLVGHRPVVLIVSTPALCTSRVCGPVTDEAVQLQQRFGNRITFLHQEVFVDNDPEKGLRPQLRALHLRTEPWVFAIDRRGVIVDRLEGAFGRHALAVAVRAAIKGT